MTKLSGDVIKYRVVNEDGSNPNLLSGIYMDVYGDFEHAFDDYGLPLYVSIDNGTTYTAAIPCGRDGTVWSNPLLRVCRKNSGIIRSV